MGISAIFCNPFSAALPLGARVGMLNINNCASTVMPNDPESELIPMSSGILGTANTVLALGGLALFIPGLIATPVGAALFAGIVAMSLLRSVNSIKNLIGSLCSFDIGGILLNGLATAGNLITALPIGRLFGNFSGTIAAIQRTAAETGGGFRNWILAGARHLYGHELAFGATTVAGRTGGMRALLYPTAGTGVAGPAVNAARNPGFCASMSNWWS